MAQLIETHKEEIPADEALMNLFDKSELLATKRDAEKNKKITTIKKKIGSIFGGEFVVSITFDFRSKK
jgi:hypothetical protein